MVVPTERKPLLSEIPQKGKYYGECSSGKTRSSAVAVISIPSTPSLFCERRLWTAMSWHACGACCDIFSNAFFQLRIPFEINASSTRAEPCRRPAFCAALHGRQKTAFCSLEYSIRGYFSFHTSWNDRPFAFFAGGGCDDEGPEGGSAVTGVTLWTSDPVPVVRLLEGSRLMELTHGPLEKVQSSWALDWEWREQGCGENPIIH